MSTGLYISRVTDEWLSLCCQRSASEAAELEGGCRRPSEAKAGVKGQFGLEQLSSQGKDFMVMAFNAGLGQDEDRWKLIIQTSHMLFCDCGDYIRHLQQILGPQWLSTSGGEGDSGGQDGAGEGTSGDPTDQLLAAALDAAEELAAEPEQG